MNMLREIIVEVFPNEDNEEPDEIDSILDL